MYYKRNELITAFCFNMIFLVKMYHQLWRLPWDIAARFCVLKQKREICGIVRGTFLHAFAY